MTGQTPHCVPSRASFRSPIDPPAAGTVGHEAPVYCPETPDCRHRNGATLPTTTGTGNHRRVCRFSPSHPRCCSPETADIRLHFCMEHRLILVQQPPDSDNCRAAKPSASTVLAAVQPGGLVCGLRGFTGLVDDESGIYYLGSRETLHLRMETDLRWVALANYAPISVFSRQYFAHGRSVAKGGCMPGATMICPQDGILPDAGVELGSLLAPLLAQPPRTTVAIGRP